MHAVPQVPVEQMGRSKVPAAAHAVQEAPHALA
jgi:hypothetical protein